MAKFISNRQKNLKIGISSYTDNQQVLEVTGNVGIKTSDTQDYELYVAGDANISGIVSATAYYGGGGNLEDIIANINVSKIEGIELQEEGSGIGTSFSTINFVGQDITVTGTGNTATVTLGNPPADLNNNQNFGLVTQSVEVTEDFGSTSNEVEDTYDFGTVITTGVVHPSEFLLPSFTINTLPSASPAGKMLFVTDETGGSVPAFSDGSSWRRITDRQIVS